VADREAPGIGRLTATAPSNMTLLWSVSPARRFPGRRTAGRADEGGELRATYEAWCVVHDHKPLSMPKFAAELKRLGYAKWKSCGLIRYRDLQFEA
jgi:hypothetical protein